MLFADGKWVQHIRRLADGIPPKDFAEAILNPAPSRVMTALRTQEWNGSETDYQQAAQLVMFMAGSVELWPEDGVWAAQWRETSRMWKGLRCQNRLSDEIGLYVLTIATIPDKGKRYSCAWRLEQIQRGELPVFKPWEVQALETEGLTPETMEEALWNLG